MRIERPAGTASRCVAILWMLIVGLSTIPVFRSPAQFHRIIESQFRDSDPDRLVSATNLIPQWRWQGLVAALNDPSFEVNHASLDWLRELDVSFYAPPPTNIGLAVGISLKSWLHNPAWQNYQEEVLAGFIWTPNRGG